MRTLTARPALRWLVPLAVLLAVLASFLVVTRANAKAPLPAISAQDLLAKVGEAKVDGMSGTVVQTTDLGIPAIPGGSGSSGSTLTSLLSGSHTMNVYYAAPDKARVAIRDDYAETDLITNGSDVWSWDSSTNKATHTTLTGRDGADKPDWTTKDGTPQTPQEAAQQVIAKITPTTEIAPVTTTTVANRDAYELVLTPKDSTSLVTQVRVAVDGATYVPLRVQVFGAGDQPAVDVGYTDVDFATPAASNFDFTLPKGATLTEKAAPEPKTPTAAQKKELEAKKAQAQKDTTTVGEGWGSVVVTKVPADATSNDQLKSFLAQLKPVSGSWGTGRELDGTIVTAILTDDGRLAVGAVGPDAVAAALAR